MTLANKIPVLLIFPVGSIAIYFLGASVSDIPSDMVSSSRDWLLIFLGVYTLNYIVAWRLKESWPISMARMLGCGLFAYIAISELVDVFGSFWGHWTQLLGGEGPLKHEIVGAVRYSTVVWIVALVMMVLCVAMGFEDADDSDER